MKLICNRRLYQQFASLFLATIALTYITSTRAQLVRDLPEPASGVTAKSVAFAKQYMVAAAHPLATEAGLEILARGGSAIDATIAVQLVLNLVEPQSSGIGGGAFMLHFDATKKTTVAYDGRETAPMLSTPKLFLGEDSKPIRFADAVRSGKSVGVPGVLRALEAAHAAYGKLTWAALFEPAIRLAENGYPLSARTVQQASGTQNSALMQSNPATKAMFFNADNTPKAAGTIVKNIALANLLKRIAKGGADAFYIGETARNIAAAVSAHVRPGVLSEADLAGYRTRISEPVCGLYRTYRVCGMPMPSSGGVAIVQMLGVLERFDMGALKPNSAEAIHLFSEAGRLAYADREKFAADDRFADVPVAALISADYLRTRSALIRTDKTLGRAPAGTPVGVKTATTGDATLSETGTSHISIVDAAGNAVSMTTSIDASFGSLIFVDGFFLNNQLTDFSLTPTDADGNTLANAVFPGKRPRSAMSPMLVSSKNGELTMSIGSALGSTIINQVAKTIVGVIDWKLDMQAAISLPNIGSRNGPTDLEKNTPAEKASAALQALGHEVRIADIPGGLQGILRVPGGWQGGADPRRDGVARGK
jgi:gamma-glutamyltranspeptidase / glutathione hydrolase